VTQQMTTLVCRICNARRIRIRSSLSRTPRMCLMALSAPVSFRLENDRRRSSAAFKNSRHSKLDSLPLPLPLPRPR
jgi:hypothetical protein